ILGSDMKSWRVFCTLGWIFLGVASNRQSFGAGVVNSADEASLRAALAGGGSGTFNCDGQISLAATLNITNDTVSDATGHGITINGSNTVEVFFVSTNGQLTLRNMVVANGKSTNGGAIFNNGSVTASNVLFSGNKAVGAVGAAANPGGTGQG